MLPERKCCLNANIKKKTANVTKMHFSSKQKQYQAPSFTTTYMSPKWKCHQKQMPPTLEWRLNANIPKTQT